MGRLSTHSRAPQAPAGQPDGLGPEQPPENPAQPPTIIPFEPTASRSAARVRVFGTEIDSVTPDAAIARILTWCQKGERHLVVTPNLDHVIALRHNEELRAVYRRAGLVLADGMPLVWASRIGGHRLQGRVTGSDLIVPLCHAAAAARRSVFLFGSSFETLCRAASRLSRLAPELTIAGIYAPPFGEAFDDAENDAAIAMINSVEPDLVLVALGMPKQELWAGRNLQRLETHAVLCIGAGLDYLAGTVRRAPIIMQRLGLEWLWRAVTEPTRLGPRYARDLAYLPLLLFEQVVATLFRRR